MIKKFLIILKSISLIIGTSINVVGCSFNNKKVINYHWELIVGTKIDVFSLVCDKDNNIYAGSSNGKVYKYLTNKNLYGL